jgi:excisionase family DNA binding protein
MNMAMTTTPASARSESSPLMLRVEEAARLCGLGRSKFLEMAYAGEVPGLTRFGRAVRVNRRMLEAWLDEPSQGHDPGAKPE